MLGNADPDTAKCPVLFGFFFWYALMKENCCAGARSAKVQNQHATHGRYEEFINKSLHAVTSGASALAGAQVLQEHCSV